MHFDCSQVGQPPLLTQIQRRSNEEWMHGLQGTEQGKMLDDLRIVLAYSLCSSFGSTLHRRGSVDQIEDFVQEALMKVVRNLGSFRGESRFTTWAQKIAMRVALSEMRRKEWKNVSLDKLLLPPMPVTPSPLDLHDPQPTPEEKVAGRMALDLVFSIIDSDLTPLQREALLSITVDGTPMEEVAENMGTNRNALYKLLHDARRNLRRELERRGIGKEEPMAEAFFA